MTLNHTSRRSAGCRASGGDEMGGFLGGKGVVLEEEEDIRWWFFITPLPAAG